MSHHINEEQRDMDADEGDAMTPDTRPLLDVPDLSHQFKVPPGWVYAKVASGELPYVRVGRYLRFRPTAIDAYLRKQERG